MSVLTTAASELEDNIPFSVETGAVLQLLRTSISEMLDSLPNSVRSTRDLQKVFGLDLKLCWHVMKIAGPGDPLSLAQFVPTAAPMRRFIAAAKNFGVPAPILERIRAAYDQFEEQVAAHAGDRTTFETMAMGSLHHDGSDEDLRRADLKRRKAGFQMHSHYCGTQMETSLSATLLHPGSAPGTFDLAHLGAKLGQRRLRADSDFIIDSFKCTPGVDPAIERDTMRKETFDPESFEKYGAPIIARFCSHPLPKFTTSVAADGMSVTTVAGGSIGQKSSVNLVFGRSVPNAPLESTGADGKRVFGQYVTSTVPTALVIADVVLHRPTFPKVDFDMAVNWMPFRYSPPASNDTRSAPLPFRERIVKLDAGVDGARTREIPQYVEILTYICSKANWNVHDFDVYRVRIEYPLLYSAIWMNFYAVPVSRE